MEEKQINDHDDLENAIPVEGAPEGLEPAGEVNDLGNESPNLQTIETSNHSKTKKGGKWIWLGVLVFLLLLVIGVLFGYRDGIRRRLAAEKAVLMEQIAYQLEWTYKDIDGGRYENAKARLDYIIDKYPDFPGIADLMTQVMGHLNQPTATPTRQVVIVPTEPGVTATPDLRDADDKYAQLEKHIANQEWDQAIQTVQSLKENNFDYRTIDVDGLYFIALRNRGIQRIWAGELEQGMYDLSMASALGASDSQAAGAENWASLYMTGASYWDANWLGAVEIFGQLYEQLPFFSDSTGMTTSERYRVALYRLGDQYARQGDYCTASSYYAKSLAVGSNPDIQVTATAFAEACANPVTTPAPSEPTQPPDATPTETPALPDSPTPAP